MKMATRIRDRAIRRTGELLKQIPPATGAHRKSTGADTLSRKDAAEQAGMSKRQKDTAINVANVPQDDFEGQVDSDKPPTVTTLAKQGRKPAPRPIIDLKGRDPDEFNRSMHFVGAFESYQRDIESLDIEKALPGLNDTERQRLRVASAAIDTIHDRIITRI